ncbi:MAG: lamin tail domain-containing protein [Bacteroidetes bacterium]|nr:lamin tail domain-containing protein [Bacteroidota bacterium]
MTKNLILAISASLFLMSNAIAQYCSPTSNPGPGTNYIQGVYTPNYWAGITASGSPSNYPYYTDYTSIVVPYEIAQGGLYSLWVLSGPSTLTCAAYIDFNGDFDFTDPGELIGQFTGASANQVSYINYTVPVTALVGTTRMRLRSGLVSAGPCTPSSFSEAEDYTVNIAAGSYPYCYPNFGGFRGPSSFINSVSLGSISNVTGLNPPPVYINYTNLSTNVNTGGNYSLIVQSSADPNYFAAWIDYNHDNTFSTNEKLGELDNSLPFENLSFNFNVPATALSGITRMRVRNHNSSGVDPCSNTMYGETEDYAVNIVGGGGGSCNELFFSEYLEGSSNDKALEIYNPGSTAINLAPYTIETYNNGSTTASATYSLTGTLASNDVFVIANPSASTAILSLADATNTICQFNGNDAVVLKKNGNILDVIGEVGVNPGTFWSVGTGSTLDHTLVRNFNITGPQNSWTLSQNQWTSHPNNTISFLGSHSSSCDPTGVEDLNSNTTNVSISPNPFNDYVTITLDKSFIEEPYKITDSMGILLSTGMFSEKTNSINLGGLSKGIYFFENWK